MTRLLACLTGFGWAWPGSADHVVGAKDDAERQRIDLLGEYLRSAHHGDVTPEALLRVL